MQSLKPGAGLGLHPVAKPAGAKKKKSRGGARARRARAAAEVRAARGAMAEDDAAVEAAGGAPGLFGFINNLEATARAQRSGVPVLLRASLSAASLRPRRLL